MKIRDSISTIRTFSKLLNADDIISDRAIAKELKNTAKKFIKQQTDRRKLFGSSNIFTSLDCVKMEEVPLSVCCDYVSECTISRSINKIPRILEGIYGLLYQGVWDINKRNRYKETTANRYANYLKLGLEKKQKFFWIIDSYIYISDPAIETVSISAYFEDDVDQNNFTCGTTSVCPTNPYDLEFKCPGYLVSDVEKETYNILLQIYKRSIADDTSNNRDESK